MPSKIYVGLRHDTRKREVFRSAVVPTETTHGSVYVYAVGPFRTVRGARYMAMYQDGSNPHLQTVSDAERHAALEVRNA